MTRRKKTLIVFGILAFIAFRSGKKAAPVAVAADTAKTDTVARKVAEESAALRDDSTQIALGMLPFEARTALRFDARAFVVYRPDEYDSRRIASYPASGSDGLFIVRANLQGLGNDYVFAGRNRGTRSVMALMRRTHNGGWAVRNVTSGEIGTHAPIDSASVWIRRARHGHPNGQWDAIVVRRLYATGDDAEDSCSSRAGELR
jgi:hypothetical protein